MAQTILTFITPIDPDKLEGLKQILAKIQKDLYTNAYLPFGSLTLVHFASLVILDDDPDYTPYLVFENNFDGPLDPYLEELMLVAGSGLHQVYSCCSGYNRESFDPANLHAYLRDHAVLPNAYHIGNLGREAKRIRQEQALREQIEGHLDKVVAAGAPDSSAACRDSVQRFVTREASLAWALPPIGPWQTLSERIKPWVNIAIFLLVLLIFLPILLPVIAVWVVILRYHEKRDPGPEPPDNDHIEELAEREDRIVQNHLADITIVKPGKFRRRTLWMFLWIVNFAARTQNKGELGGIPSIHFAHWSIIDNGRRLLFLSNFDGSWIGYLDDFIDKAGFGLTGIWTNTKGFPRTRYLVCDGARNEADFKAFARNTQVPTLVWYSAYPDLTVQSVDRDSLIRQKLFAPLDDASVKDYMQLF